MEELVELVLCLFLLLLLLVLFLLPTIIAFARGHHYKWIVLVMNVFGSFVFGSGWFIAFIWSIWPSDTGFLDPVVNDPTSNSKRSNNVIYSRYGENCRSFSEAANAGEHEGSLEGEIAAEGDVGGTAPNNFCPACGEKNDGHSKYCKNCGCKLC